VDFAHLRTREAEIGAFIDRLPEGSAIGYKALAANIAGYGQQACGKALNFLSDEGHLRRVKEHLQLDDNTWRWVTHTYWSRTARDDDWWKAFVESLHGIDLTLQERRARAALEAALSTEPKPGQSPPDQEPEPRDDFEPDPEPEPIPAPAPLPAAAAPAAPAPSDAYRTLARLGRTEPRMTLSAAECAALESLAAQWLARGATPDHLTRSLTEGLPHPMHSPGAIARIRLENKMPPEPIQERAYVTRAFIVCMTCEVPDNVKTLIRGVCIDCREEMQAYDVAEEAGIIVDRIPDTFRSIPAQVDIARRADEARAAAGFKARTIPQPTHGDLTRAYSAARGASPSAS
jgi:hypothetical protein